MSHRTQITIDDEHYELLRREMRTTGASLAELIRRAIDQTYKRSSADSRQQALDVSFASWADLDITGYSYVESTRHDFNDRLEQLWRRSSTAQS